MRTERLKMLARELYAPSAWICVTAVFAVASGCARPLAPFAGTPPQNAGEWRGTTSQGMPIAFSVDANETLTALTLGYDFNGCSGSQTFSGLLVPTAPDVTCIPGPCVGAVASYRSFGYSHGSAGGGPFTQVNGLFLPGNQARGQARFVDYASCGTAAVEWTATKQ
jgi:hypothetical protein